MKKLKLRKVTASVLLAASIITLNPMKASAEWRQDSAGWWYAKGSSWSQGWDLIDSKWYYFGQDGYMKTGWLEDGGNWYYLYSSGEMAESTSINGYLIDSNGVWVQTGWRQDSKGRYYVNKNGDRETGKLTNGWATIDSKKYLFGPDGYMKTGWAQSGKDWYYIYQSGEKATDTVIEGYTLDLDGVRINKPTKEEEEARNLILKEDSNFIAKKGSDYKLLKRCSYGGSEELLDDKWKMPGEGVYAFTLLDSEVGAGYTYLVGKTSKNVYILPTQGFFSAYQIKDNQVAKTFEWNGDGAKSDDWRNK